MLTLESAQARLSWDVVLRKRAGYRAAFHDFDLRRVAAITDADLEALRKDAGIVRNRLKIYSTRGNARAILDIQDKQGSSIPISADSLMAALRSTTSPTLVKFQPLALSATASLKT